MKTLLLVVMFDSFVVSGIYDTLSSSEVLSHRVFSIEVLTKPPNTCCPNCTDLII